MNNNDILGTQNWKQSQADPFLAQKVAIFGKYSYVDNVDEIFNPHPHIPHMRIIRIIRIFRIRMANPSCDTMAELTRGPMDIKALNRIFFGHSIMKKKMWWKLINPIKFDNPI